jgi:hypothetical protein
MYETCRERAAVIELNLHFSGDERLSCSVQMSTTTLYDKQFD